MRLGCRSFETTRAVASKKFSFHVSGEGKSVINAGKKKKKILPSSLSQVVCAYRAVVYIRPHHTAAIFFTPRVKREEKFYGFFEKSALSPFLVSLRRFLTQIHIWYHYVLLQQQQHLTNFHTLLWDVPNTAYYFIKLKFSLTNFEGWNNF